MAQGLTFVASLRYGETMRWQQQLAGWLGLGCNSKFMYITSHSCWHLGNDDSLCYYCTLNAFELRWGSYDGMRSPSRLEISCWDRVLCKTGA